MACSEHMWDLLKRLSTGSLKGEELEFALSHIEECNACSEDLEVFASLTSAIAHRRESLLEIEQEDSQKLVAASPLQKIKRRLEFLYTPVPLPAKVLVPVAALVVVFLTYTTFSHRYGDYAELADLSPAVYVPSALRGGEDEREILFGAAMEEYLKGNYEEAAKVLSKIVDDQNYDEKAGFYLGVCLLLSGEREKAVFHLQRTADSKHSNIRQKSLWYLAQADILMGELGSARSRLEEIVGEGGKMAPRAREQLQKIAQVQEEL